MTTLDDLPAFDEPYDLDPEVVASFREHGHVRVTKLASRAELDAYRDVIYDAATNLAWDKRPLEERDTYGKAFLQAMHLWRRVEEVRRFTFGKRFARVAAQLLEVDGVRLYNDQALFKEPGGGHTPWHQDQTYWPLDSDRTITMWLAFDDIRPPQSGMTFADGTHRMGDLGFAAISDASEEYYDKLLADRGLATHTYDALDAGDATFHAGWTLHRAGPNPTDRMRPAMTVIYLADGTRVSEPKGPEQELDLKLWLKGLQPGDVITGDRNPLLFSWRLPGT